MTERVVQANGMDIWTESFGDPANMPVLLIMGASVQSIFWPDELIQRLVDAGRFVIRYDNRDTGQSTCVDFATDPYTLDDMALDALGVLDAYGLDRAHFVGTSMGGMITQILMINHPQRVSTATLMLSSPVSGDDGEADGEGDKGEAGAGAVAPSASDLPGPSAQWLERAAAWALLPENTPEELIAKRVESLSMMVGSAEPFNVDEQRELARREVERARNYSACAHHTFAMFSTRPGDRRPLLATVDIPTLVIHGNEDPILPYPHGVALAETIPGATLLTLDGVGHEMLPGNMPEMTAAIIALQNKAP